MSANIVRVVKVGGSLFDMPRLGERLQRWLDAQPPATNILVAGGGELANSIRELDRLHGIGELPAHWLCVRAMAVTARVLVDLMPNSALVDDLESARQLTATRPFRSGIFDPMPLLMREEPKLPGVVLPHGWSVTSDSIAARVAELLSADELVLLKSNLPPCDGFEEAAGANYVDEFFPNIAGQLAGVRCVNLRDDRFPQHGLS